MYSFNLPLLFFLSGYLFKVGDEPWLRIKSKGKALFPDIIWNKIQTIILPYWVYTVFSILLALFCGWPVTVTGSIAEMTYFHGTVGWNSPLWFFPALFFSWIICYCLFKLNRSFLFEAIVVGICVVISFFVEYMPLWMKTFGLLRVFMVIPLFMVGYWIKKFNLLEKIRGRIRVLLVIFLLLIGIVFGTILNPKILLYEYIYHNFFFVFIGTNAILFAIVLIFSSFERYPRIINNFGKVTFFIIGTHVPVVMIYRKILTIYLVEYSDIFVILSSLIVTIILLFLQYGVARIIGKFPKVSLYFGLR